MFARVLALLPLALLASASHLEARQSCSTGEIQCCNSLQNQSQAAKFLSEKGIVLPINLDVGALLGIQCTPISVLGLGGNSCTAQTACCENNNFNGLVNIGCTPINLNA